MFKVNIDQLIFNQDYLPAKKINPINILTNLLFYRDTLLQYIYIYIYIYKTGRIVLEIQFHVESNKSNK